jgi:exosortase
VTPLLIGMAAYLWGWRAARVIAFPSAFLLFGLGLYRGLLSSIGFVLQDVTAQGTALVGQSIGLSIIRDGLVLRSGPGSQDWAFVVAQACSGMSSLLSLLSLATLLIYVARGSATAKGVVLLGVAPLVILANTIRVTLVVAVASAFGEEAALGVFHGASSLLLFGTSLLGLVILSRTVGCRLPAFATSS